MIAPSIMEKSVTMKAVMAGSNNKAWQLLKMGMTRMVLNFLSIKVILMIMEIEMITSLCNLT